MASRLESLQTEALHLAPEERLRLANVLLASVEPAGSGANEAAWDAVIRRRIAEFDAGKVETVSGKDVFAELDRRLSR